MPHRDDFDDDLMDSSTDAYDYKPIASDETGGMGRVMKLFLSVTVIAAIAGGAWYFVGTEKTTGDNIPVVRADVNITKVKPNDPGGMSIPNRDKTIYDRVDGNNTEPKLEHLLPHPEKPLEKPSLGMPLPELSEKINPETGMPVISKEIEPFIAETSNTIANATVKPGKEALENAKVLPEIPAEEMAEAIKAPTPPILDVNAPRPLIKRGEIPVGPTKQDEAQLAEKIKEALMDSPSKTDKVVDAANETPKQTQAIKTAPAVESGYLLQLLSSKSESAVQSSWERIKAKNTDVLKNISSEIVKADLGADKGIYYRLRVGPVPTADDAKELCSQLKKRSVGCLIVRVR